MCAVIVYFWNSRAHVVIFTCACVNSLVLVTVAACSQSPPASEAEPDPMAHIDRGMPRWSPDQYRQRPQDPYPALTEAVLARLSNGELLTEICVSTEMPLPATWFDWLRVDPELAARYDLAVEVQSIVHSDYLVEASEDPDARRARVRVDAIKFRLEKLNPAKFGNRQPIVTTESTGATSYDGREVRRKIEGMAAQLAEEAARSGGDA